MHSSSSISSFEIDFRMSQMRGAGQTKHFPFACVDPAAQSATATPKCVSVIKIRLQQCMLCKNLQLIKIHPWCLNTPNQTRNELNGNLPNDSAALSFQFHYCPFLHLTLQQLLPFGLFLAPGSSSVRSLEGLSQSRLARLVVGPFWGWNCTGGSPSVHWNTAQFRF